MGVNVVKTTVEIIIVTALLPIIAVTIASTQNLTATETTLLALVTLFLIIGLIYGIAKSEGLIKG